MDTSLSENKMGVLPINRLLVTMSLPMMLSMLVLALYNVVDSVFVSRLGTDALTALSLAFSVQNFIIAVATGTGVGINALLSKSLGEKKFDLANKTAENGVFLAVCSAVFFFFVGVLAVKPYYAMFHASERAVKFGVEYLTVCCIGSFSIFGQITFERLLQSVGKTLYSMTTQITGALINIVLDPIFIYGLFGFPRLEVLGAALATVTGQTIAMLLALFFNMRFNHEIKMQLKGFKPNGRIIKKIYSVGVPSIAMTSIGSLMTVGVNQIVRLCGDVADTARAVFGVYFKLQSFVFMPVFGLNNGLVPIVAYNFGAKKKKRLTQAIRLGVVYASTCMLVGFLLFQFVPEVLLGFFDTGTDMDMILKVGVPALRIISVSFLFAGFCIVTSSVLQALGHGFSSLAVSVVRQLVVLVPVAFLFAYFTQNIDLVWLCFPIAEIASLVMSAFYLLRVYRKEIKPMA